MFLKICGITRLIDARHAIEAGATALGFVLWPQSPRFVSNRKVAEIVASLPPSVVTVGVFVNETVAHMRAIRACVGLDAIQLHGDEGPEIAEALSGMVIRAVRGVVRDAAEAEAMHPLTTRPPARRPPSGHAL